MNEAADKYFVGNAQLLKRLMTLENALSANTKFVVPSNGELVNIIGDMAGILPMVRPTATTNPTRPQAAPPEAAARTRAGHNGG